MNLPTILRLVPLCAVILLQACQKEASNSEAVTNSTASTHASGVVPDDPLKVAKLPVIISSNFTPVLHRISDLESPGANRGGKPVKPSADITPPTVAITSPANGSTVSGSISINVTASDNVGVSSVAFSLDGAVIKSLSAAPFNFLWDASTALDGTHTISAKATDAAGNSSTVSISVAKNTTITVLPPPTSTFPASFSLIMPPVQHQGAEGSCVAFSTTYAARSVEQYYRTLAASYSFGTNIFSPEFVYDQTKIGDCGSGTAITTALDFMKNKGVCTWQTMAYSTDNGCSLIPTTTQFNEAANYKIASYSWLYESDQNAMKTMLLNHHAIIIMIQPDDSFWNATSGFIWKAFSGPQVITHSVAICGYDDAKHAYKVMNSWGTTWGDAGYSWIDYDFLPYTGTGIGYVITN